MVRNRSGFTRISVSRANGPFKSTPIPRLSILTSTLGPTGGFRFWDTQVLGSPSLRPDADPTLLVPHSPSTSRLQTPSDGWSIVGRLDPVQVRFPCLLSRTTLDRLGGPSVGAFLDVPYPSETLSVPPSVGSLRHDLRVSDLLL